jgi:hypothetical protein
MQYARNYPTPEGTSNSLIQLFGQASVIFVYVMEGMKTSAGSFTPSLWLATGLLLVCLGLITQMKDPEPGIWKPPAGGAGLTAGTGPAIKLCQRRRSCVVIETIDYGARQRLSAVASNQNRLVRPTCNSVPTMSSWAKIKSMVE